MATSKNDLGQDLSRVQGYPISELTYECAKLNALLFQGIINQIPGTLPETSPEEKADFFRQARELAVTLLGSIGEVERNEQYRQYKRTGEEPV